MSRIPEWVTYVIIAISVALVISSVIWLPSWLANYSIAQGYFPESLHVQFANQYRDTTIKLIGGIAILVGAYFTARRIRAIERQTALTEQGQVTVRFTRAIEHLGSDTPSIQLGGIYALERIAKDSRDDHWTVMEVLTAFIRENAPRAEQEGEEAGLTTPATTVQAALTVIGRRNAAWDNTDNAQGLCCTEQPFGSSVQLRPWQ